MTHSCGFQQFSDVIENTVFVPLFFLCSTAIFKVTNGKGVILAYNKQALYLICS